MSKKKTGDELHEEDVSVEENLASTEREEGAVEDETPQPAEERDVEKELVDALVEAARRLQISHEFVAWLPESRSMQLELIDTHGHRLTRARALLELLQSK